jgi:transcriptional regulator with XRE-family HTH domain
LNKFFDKIGIRGKNMNRLLELRTEKNLSQRAVAKSLYISQGTYNNWENGRTQPSIEQLIVLSKFFGVSVDYLIGNSDDYQFMRMTGNYKKEEEYLLKHFRALSPDTQTLVLKLLEQLQKNGLD